MKAEVASSAKVEAKETLKTAAERLKQEHTEVKDFVLAVRRFILDHAKSLPKEKQYQPKTIIESRFTPAGEAFEKGMTSCGAMASIGAELLRHAGFQVKLVHGESEDSIDHAWVSVFDPTTESWTDYDLTRPRADIPPTHTKKLEANSWEDIKEQIHSDHATMRDRRKAKGIPERAGIEFPEIAKRLLAMREVDQKMRSAEDDGWDDDVDRKNTDAMKEIIGQIGWPTTSKVGNDASRAAWLLVQHADHEPQFQERCLVFLKEQTEGEVRLQDVAYLEDRVRVNTGRPQPYGTQFRETRNPDGQVVAYGPRPIEDPERVNERRAAMGLEPLEDYTEMITKRYYPHLLQKRAE